VCAKLVQRKVDNVLGDFFRISILSHCAVFASNRIGDKGFCNSKQKIDYDSFDKSPGGSCVLNFAAFSRALSIDIVTGFRLCNLIEIYGILLQFYR